VDTYGEHERGIDDGRVGADEASVFAAGEPFVVPAPDPPLFASSVAPLLPSYLLRTRSSLNLSFCLQGLKHPSELELSAVYTTCRFN